VVRPAILGQVEDILGAASGVKLVAEDTTSMAASLTAGVEHLPARPGQAIVIATVDSVPVQCSTLDALIAAALADGVQVATPRYRGRGGHPVVARENLLQVFRQGYTGTLRDLIHAADQARRRLDVDDPATGHDLDTPIELDAVRPGLHPEFAPSSSAPRVFGGMPKVGE
jgi:molybdenum cofactor cytidylyltransferase